MDIAILNPFSKLQSFRECSFDKFNEAMRALKVTPISNLSTDLLYIAYTKYESDVILTSGSYPQVHLKTREIRDNLLKELNRRGYSQGGYRYG